MKKGWIGICIALVCMAGCQSSNIDNAASVVSGKDTVNTAIDVHSDSESKGTNETQKTDENMDDGQVVEVIEETTSNEEISEDSQRSSIDSGDEWVNTSSELPEPAEVEEASAVPSEKATLETVNSGWAEEDMETGIQNTFRIFAQFRDSMIDETRVVKVENDYLTYYSMPPQYKSINDIRIYLEHYFTETATNTILHTYHFIEYEGQVLVPEFYNELGYDSDSVELTIGENSKEEAIRYISYTLSDENEGSKKGLLIAKRGKSDQWYLETIPGQGELVKVGDRYILDSYWATEQVEWHWPNVLSARDAIWNPILLELKETMTNTIEQKKEGYLSSAEITDSGAPSISFWVNWSFQETFMAYPSLDITLSEYVKYTVHPNHEKRTVVISSKTGKKVELSDLTTDLSAFKKEANIYIETYMREHPESFYSEVFFQGIDESTQFYLTQTGVVFYFQLYEYAPYALGYPQIEVPYGVFEGLLSSEFEADIEHLIDN